MKKIRKLYLTIVFLQDKDTGDYTAYYLQFPEACGQGRTKQEAQKLLDEIFSYLLKGASVEIKVTPPIASKAVYQRKRN